MRTRKVGYAAPLDLVGGFLDAIGAGGQGPMVNSTLIGPAESHRLSQCGGILLTVAVTTTFSIELATAHVEHIAALIIGGLLAAPFA
jgi:uncharacterized protein